MTSQVNKLKKSLKAHASFEDALKAEQAITQKDTDLIGLAFSGGGIRSATLNLGVLQALASKNLLGKFDYLSTVSGGGYIGAFLSALIHHAKGDIQSVEEKLSAKIEPSEINFLRKYSNYLTPKIGLSTDTMAALSVWFTNTLLNQLVLLSAIATICALGFFLNEAALHLASNNHLNALAVIGFLCALYAFYLAVRESFFEHSKPQDSLAINAKAQATSWREILAIGLFGVGLFSLFTLNFDCFSKLNLQPFRAVKLSPFWLINPAIVAIISLLMILVLGAAGRGIHIRLLKFRFYVSSFTREWWARLGGTALYMCFAWIAGYFLILYLPLLLMHFLNSNALPSISLWGALAAVSAFLGKTSSTSGLGKINVKEKITIFLPWLVIAGLLTLVSFGVLKLAYGFYHDGLPMMLVYLGLFISFLILTLLSAWRVDVNIFSLHYFYRNRLTRAYLGATNSKRMPNLFTGFDADDDIEFSDCQHRPLHIVNTALNLTNAKDLAWQQRLAASFSFTPLYSGFKLPNKQGSYQPTSDYAGSIQLGSIMAVSGAAASPNGGYHTAPATAFLMTMFNARLGRWYGNPLKSKWRNVSPPFGLGYLAKELLAKADIDSSYVYLSDGGHFENLGIYELVRRKCKLIIAVDAGQDGNYTFEDLGNAIRKCQVDLNVTIDINVSNIHPSKPSKYGAFKHAEKHFAVGEIVYDKASPNSNGLLLYIKNTLNGSEPTDLINFKLQQAAFPHHSTVDQFFDESQFESYRHLGEHITLNVIKEIEESTDEKQDKIRFLLSQKTTQVTK
jgi:Patatin-like phospholipase